MRRLLGTLLIGLAGPLLGGCTTTTLVLSAAGAATDTSVTWAVLKHLHDSLTAGDPTPCHRLAPLERALAPQCGEYRPGTLSAEDLTTAHLPECPLSIAAGDPRTWRVLPELIALGAQPEACRIAPLVALARTAPADDGCVDFAGTAPETLQAIQWLGDADARSIHHDVVRAFTCPRGRAVGLDRVIDGWIARGDLAADRSLPFSPLSALHPSHLRSPLGLALSAQGHTAPSALVSFDGRSPSGFDLALRLADRQALHWWLSHAPSLANRVPPARGGDLPWVPLERVLRDGYLVDAEQQRPMVELLLAHGANPSQRLPYEPSVTVLGHAVRTGHPLRDLLDAPSPRLRAAAIDAGTDQDETAREKIAAARPL